MNSALHCELTIHIFLFSPVMAVTWSTTCRRVNIHTLYLIVRLVMSKLRSSCSQWEPTMAGSINSAAGKRQTPAAMSTKRIEVLCNKKIYKIIRGSNGRNSITCGTKHVSVHWSVAKLSVLQAITWCIPILHQKYLVLFLCRSMCTRTPISNSHQPHPIPINQTQSVFLSNYICFDVFRTSSRFMVVISSDARQLEWEVC